MLCLRILLTVSFCLLCVISQQREIRIGIGTHGKEKMSSLEYMCKGIHRERLRVVVFV